MLVLLQGLVSEAVWPLVFLAVFLIIGGGALYLTPRIARWLDDRRQKHSGYYDGMLENGPNVVSKEEKEGEK